MFFPFLITNNYLRQNNKLDLTAILMIVNFVYKFRESNSSEMYDEN